MKKVALELEKMKRLHNGLGQYCWHLSQALHQYNTDFSLLCLLDESTSPVCIAENAQSKYLKRWHRVLHQAAPAADLWHLTHQDSPYLPPKRSIPQIMTVHDLNFLKGPTSVTRCRRRLRKLQKKIDRCQYITAISEASKRDLLAHCQVTVPVEVIYNGVDVVAPAAEPPRFIGQRPYLLALAEITPKKRFHLLVNLLAELPDLDLVIAGKNTHPCVEEIGQQAQRKGCADRLIMPGIVSEAEKSWLYANCEAFCFPSLSEGFGLPIVEALHFDKPVFASALPALIEVAAESAYYFTDYDRGAMLATYQAGMADYRHNQQRERVRTEKLALYTWERAAKAYLSVYDKVLSSI